MAIEKIQSPPSVWQPGPADIAAFRSLMNLYEVDSEWQGEKTRYLPRQNFWQAAVRFGAAKYFEQYAADIDGNYRILPEQYQKFITLLDHYRRDSARKEYAQKQQLEFLDEIKEQLPKNINP